MHAKATDYQMKQRLSNKSFALTQQFNKLIKQRDGK